MTVGGRAVATVVDPAATTERGRVVTTVVDPAVMVGVHAATTGTEGERVEARRSARAGHG